MEKNKQAFPAKRVLGRATLVEVRKVDGAQKYEYEGGKVEWITGRPRASNVKVGDTGVLEYRLGPSWGLIFFVKDRS